LQDIELTASSQRVSERLYNLLAVGEGRSVRSSQIQTLTGAASISR